MAILTLGIDSTDLIDISECSSSFKFSDDTKRKETILNFEIVLLEEVKKLLPYNVSEIEGFISNGVDTNIPFPDGSILKLYWLSDNPIVGMIDSSTATMEEIKKILKKITSDHPELYTIAE